MTGSRARTIAVAAALAVTVVLAVAAMWLRALIGPLWPSVLTDWSLGSVLLAVSAATVGGLLAIRIPRNVVGWLFLTDGVLTAIVLTLRQYTELQLVGGDLTAATHWTAWAFAWVIPLNMTALALLVALFPFGSPPSRRWRPVVAAMIVNGVAATLATMFSPYLPDATPFSALPHPVAIIPRDLGTLLLDVTSSGILLALVLATAAVIVRMRRSRGAERQQMKWFVFAAILAVVTFIVGFSIQWIFVIATLFALPALPIAAGIAVLRYRLYEIDRVINRTVVYGAVTAVLAVTYLIAVTAMRALTEPLAGDTAIAVAGSTLAVAALFQPVRNRIQQAVDRRFNRARYDAAATVDHLRLRFRDEVDLDTLTAELTTAVRATMQPAATSLWLRETGR